MTANTGDSAPRRRPSGRPRTHGMSDADRIDESQLAVWERWWTALDDTPGEIVWNADEADLIMDLEVLGGSFDRRLPVIDLGCGNGRQTRFLAQRFAAVLGVDIAPSAIEHARCADNPPNVSYRVLDVCSAGDAERLHRELGDANLYVRGVLQGCLPPTGPRR
jgi:SAM-dependent methyltransferase